MPSAAMAAHPLYGGVDFTRDPNLIPPPESDTDFPISSYESNLAPQFRAQQVTIGVSNPAGAIVIDPDNHFLYFMLGGDQAIRYGVGVGREGFAWSGDALIGMKRRWPRWLPPESMVERDANARKWANGMPGGPTNPLGARALYLFANGQDTLYRIHGTNEPSSIGKSMSSGCIRMLNENVADLFDRVPVGSHVRVLPSQQSAAGN
ncbi:L,D-transpeptidase [Aestuariivirga litoralis]|uniref:L,D-transpeptidase n=1 Tax=Aestuariivirga litoralis TaxID=2650924 RepID=UPI0018C7A79B|nr:L,D-transpeptidase [Aestuariivirga litoralis]